MRSWIFSIITPVFRVTWSFRNQISILIYWFTAQETFIIFINVENSCAASYFGGNYDTAFFLLKVSIYVFAVIFNKSLLNICIKQIN